MIKNQRNTWLTLADDQLLKLCKIEFYKGTGPGGQKKNKTSSGVRLIHLETELFAESAESRQQSDNKLKALKKLRFELAFQIRQNAEAAEIYWQANVKNPQYPLHLAKVLDCLNHYEWAIAESANFFETSTGKLIKYLKNNPQLWQYVNQQRQRVHLKPLK